MSARSGFWLVALAMWLPACTINIGTGGRPTPGASATQTPAPPIATGSPTMTEVVGSGNVTTESRPVSGFDRIRFRGSGNLIVEQTGAESLTIEAEDNILPLLRSDVEDGVLILGLRSGTRIVTTKPRIYRLTVKQLNGIEASGSGSTEVNGLATRTFTFDGSGSGDVRVGGTADAHDVTISGSRDYDAGSLESRTAAVRVSGSAEVVVNASESLDVQVSGSADVRYVGNPRITQQVSGSGSVSRK